MTDMNHRATIWGSGYLGLVMLPILFADVPSHFVASYEPEAPWTLLGDPLTELLELLEDRSIAGNISASAHLTGAKIVIGEDSRIHPTAVIEGPVYIGRNVDVRPGAYIRGGAWIGDHCVVGTNTEIKRAILFDHAKAPHLNYVGDSILGAHVNLGAGTVLEFSP